MASMREHIIYPTAAGEPYKQLIERQLLCYRSEQFDHSAEIAVSRNLAGTLLLEPGISDKSSRCLWFEDKYAKAQ